ncbi:MAG: CDP-archaeol synthase [Gammaproteobacteria bacterium]|nr:CDP-archaeol synthase [Gammaproteobacteria bacterium]
MPVLQLVALITLANSAPVLARHVLGDLWQQPVDAGLILRDERRLFGRSKTWRGLVAASLLCALTAPLLGLSWMQGLQVGALAMVGDLLASFIKRRLGLDAGQRAPRLDSIPEALLPTLALRDALALSWLQVALVVIAFVLTVRLASPLLYRLRMRSRPW